MYEQLDKRIALTNTVKDRVMKQLAEYVKQFDGKSLEVDEMNRLSCAYAVASYLQGGMGSPAFTANVQGTWTISDSILNQICSDDFDITKAIEKQCSMYPDSAMSWGKLLMEEDDLWISIIHSSRE